MSASGGGLDGVRVLVTRPRERAQELCFLLEDEGAEVTCLPVLELHPPDDLRPLQSAAEQLHRYRWILFASTSGVQALVEAARQAGTVDHLRRAKIGAVGPATARAVRGYGLEVTVEAADALGVGLFDSIRDQLGPHDEVLLPAAQEGRLELHHALADAGIQAIRVSAYRSAPSSIEPAQWAAIRASPPQLILFGSPRTAEAFIEGLGANARALLERSRLVAIGPTTGAALQAMGLSVAAVAEHPTSRDWVEAAIRAIRG